MGPCRIGAGLGLLTLALGCAHAPAAASPAPLEAIEQSAAGCWQVFAPRLARQPWHLVLDSAGYLTPIGMPVRSATSPEATRRYGRGSWHRANRFLDSLDITFGAPPPQALRLRVAVQGDTLTGTSYAVTDVAPFESRTGAAQLVRAPC